MPAVCLCDAQRAEQKTKRLIKWMRGKMAEERVSQRELAGKLGMTQPAFSYHITNCAPFDTERMLVIFKELKAEDEEILKFMKL